MWGNNDTKVSLAFLITILNLIHLNLLTFRKTTMSSERNEITLGARLRSKKF